MQAHSTNTNLPDFDFKAMLTRFFFLTLPSFRMMLFLLPVTETSKFVFSSTL
jgi:hypothetical protein